MMRGHLQSLLDNALEEDPISPDRVLSHFFTGHVIYVNLKKSQFDSKQTPHLKHKPIEKLQFLIYSRIHMTPILIEQCALLVRYEDHSHGCYYVKASSAFVLYHELIRQGAKPEPLFYNINLRQMDWVNVRQSTIYKLTDDICGPRYSPTLFYKRLHELLITNVLFTMMHKKPNQVFNVIDGGCGNGLFTKRLESNLRSYSTIYQAQTKLAGFDFNPNNIEDCKMEYSGTSHFLVGNLLDVESTIKKLQESRAIFTRSSAKTILVLSGSLTRMVLSNLFEGLKVFASIARCSNIDYVFGGGLGDLLITDYFAKQFGFQSKDGVKTSDEFLYSRLPFADFLKQKRDKLYRKNVLDLSFCQNPRIFQKLKNLVNKDTVIDLSYCHYTPDINKSLASVLRKFPAIKIIFQHYDADVLAAYAAAFPQSANSAGFEPAPRTSEFSLFGYNRRQLRYEPWTEPATRPRPQQPVKY